MMAHFGEKRYFYRPTVQSKTDQYSGFSVFHEVTIHKVPDMYSIVRSYKKILISVLSLVFHFSLSAQRVIEVKPGYNKLFSISAIDPQAAVLFKYQSGFQKGCIHPNVNQNIIYLLPIT